MKATVMEFTPTERQTGPRGVGRAAREGLKGLFKAQTILLDFAADQNAIAFRALRERANADDRSPATALIDSVEDIFEGVVAMQRSIVDYGMDRIERERPAKKDGESPKEDRVSMGAIPLGELLRKNFEATVEAQREILRLIEKQGKLGVKVVDEMAQTTAGKSMKSLASRARESVENLLETQSRLIELTARQGRDSVALLMEQDKPIMSKELARHAEEAIDNIRRTQKKLLDIARDLNERIYERAGRDETGAETGAEVEETAPSRFAERLRNGIERAVKAQNELLDVSLRTVSRTKPAEG